MAPRRVQEPQPTDLDERLTALRRRTAAASRARERPPQPTEHPQPHTVPSPRSPRPPAPPRRTKHSPDADPDDFSRRLKISSPEPQSRPSTKLYNPHAEPVPLRRTAEPEPLSDATSSSYLPRAPPVHSPSARDRESQPRQLFDHRKDDPMRFSVLARPPRPTPTPKSSGDYLSASSTSSYSSAFTLSSATDGSSASSALFDRPAGGGGSRGEDAGTNVFALQLKKLYRAITNLETKVKTEDTDDRNADDAGSAAGSRRDARVTVKGKQPPESPTVADEDLEREKWKVQIANHKQLADYIHNLLQISLAPTVPASLRNIPTKYNIIVRLWTYAFHKVLESLRRASFSSLLAFEHLQDFIYYAYGFYTGLLEEPTLSGFKSGWLEALGDLARYRMAVSAMVNGGTGSSSSSGRKLTQKDVNEVVTDDKDADKPKKPTGSISDKPAARIDDSPSPSVGIIAARLLEVESEPELWRRIAKEWYGSGLAEQPGTGKLHHHLGLLSREVEGEDLKGIYHFVKSMTALHPFSTSRESVLPMWSHAAQTRRAQSDTASTKDLFVLLHGMLFTHIQLDDFAPTLARFVERLEMEDPEEREWLMMSIVNIASVFEYGKTGSVLGRLGGKDALATTIMITKPATGDDERMDVDEPKKTSPVVLSSQFPSEQVSPAPSEAGDTPVPIPAPPSLPPEHPPAFKYALQLTFAMLSHVLNHPIRNSTSAFGAASLNPYLVALLTFLATVLKNPPTLRVLERSVPWEELAAFFAKIPRGVMIRQGLFATATAPTPEKKDKDKELGGGARWALTSGCAPPLPEDWCIRGMEWVGRNVFERGYWKSGEERRAEIEVLEERDLTEEVMDGQIENDDDDDENGGVTVNGSASRRASSSSPPGVDVMKKRWVRIVRSAVGIASVVAGFTWVQGTREWKVEGSLAEKVRGWQEEDHLEREMEERRRSGTRWADDSMDVDEEDVNDSFSDEEDDENDTEEVKALKARRRYLQSLLQTSGHPPPVTSSPPRRRARVKKPIKDHPSLSITPGYTVLVIDTNILLSSLSMISSLIESLRWTIIVPLPVIMELDGLSTNTSLQLSEAAQSAIAYISSHIRTHTLSLKVQTSKGNFLNTLSIRTEQVDFSADGNWERNMDDLILKAAIWQEEHWVNRSAMLKCDHTSTKDISRAVKVVLLSLDRNLRLKARSRQLPAASEKDLASILANAT